MDLAHLGVGIGLDLIVIVVLAYGIYFRRHGKADLALAFVALNVGVFAAVALLASAEVGMGLAFGLFGILSIIRLRSTQLSQGEVAYYFVALVLGLVHALGSSDLPVVIAADVLLLTIMAVLDRDALPRAAKEQRVVLDRAIPSAALVREELAFRLDAEVLDVEIEQVDFVQDVTTVLAKVRRRTDEPPLSTKAFGTRADRIGAR